MSGENDWKCGVEWEEDRFSKTDRECPDRALNMLSFPIDGDFYKSTKKALAWRVRDEMDPGRAAVPAAFVEKLFRLAQVEKPSDLIDAEGLYKFLTRCLAVTYLGAALDLLIEHGLLRVAGGEDLMVYEGEGAETELSQRSDTLTAELKDHEVMRVKSTSWDWTKQKP